MMPSRSSIIIFRISLAAALTGIMILATTPLSYPVISGVNDKFSHILAFFVLALLTDESFPETKFNLAMALPVFGYGVAIEMIQHFLPYRMFSLWDITADGCGIGLYKMVSPFTGKLIDRVFLKIRIKTELIDSGDD